MTYASTSIDRRAEYYARAASVIAADPLDFYTRAERGRRFQASRNKTRGAAPVLTAVPSAPVEMLSWRNELRSQMLAGKGVAA